MKRSLRVFKLIGLGLFLLSLVGCGGLFSTNSTILIHLKQNVSTQVMNVGYEIYVVPAGGTLNLANPTTFATTQNNPNLLDNYVSTRTSTTEIDLQFSTRSSQTPYYIYIGIPSESGATDTVQVSVDVDASTGAYKVFTFPTNAQTQVTTASYTTSPITPGVPAQINRNSATY